MKNHIPFPNIELISASVTREWHGAQRDLYTLFRCQISVSAAVRIRPLLPNLPLIICWFRLSVRYDQNASEHHSGTP